MKWIMMITTALAFVSPAHGQDDDKGDKFPVKWRGYWCDLPNQDDIPYDKKNPEAGIAGKTSAKRCAEKPNEDTPSDQFRLEADRMSFWEGGCGLEFGRYDKDTNTFRGLWICGSEGSQWAKSSKYTVRNGILTETFRTTDYLPE